MGYHAEFHRPGLVTSRTSQTSPTTTDAADLRRVYSPCPTNPQEKI